MKETLIVLGLIVAFVVLAGFAGAWAFKTVEAKKEVHCETLWSMTATPTDSIIVLIECGTG